VTVIKLDEKPETEEVSNKFESSPASHRSANSGLQVFYDKSELIAVQAKQEQDIFEDILMQKRASSIERQPTMINITDYTMKPKENKISKVQKVTIVNEAKNEESEKSSWTDSDASKR